MGTTGEKEKYTELLAKTLAYGVRENLVFFIDRFIDASSKDLHSLDRMEQLLLDSLYPETRLRAIVTVFNSGKRPAILKPFGLLNVSDDDLSDGDFVMKVSRTSNWSTEQEQFVSEWSEFAALFGNLLSGQSQDKGTHVRIDPFFPDDERISYLMISPEDKVTIQLSSIDPLLAKAKTLREIYDLNVLTARIALSTLDGRILESKFTVFGRSISDELREELVDIMSR